MLRKLWSALSTLLVIGVVVLAILLVGVRVVGLTPYAVLSGSMEPTYHVGSLIYVKAIAPEEITVGTPITFVVNEDLLVATHRVVDLEKYTTRTEPVVDENGNPVLDENGDPVTQEVPLEEPSYYFQTKGDANDVVDGAAVYYKNVIGTPVFSIPYLGYLSSWLQTRQGMIMGIAIALVLLILTFLPDLLNLVDDEQKKPEKEEPEVTQEAAAAEAIPEEPQTIEPVTSEKAPETQEEPQTRIRRPRSLYKNQENEQGGPRNEDEP